jgi:hypothetical protein
MGVIPKVAKFLGVDKFGKGIAAATRTLTGEVRQDIETQQTADASVQKLLYAAKREQDPNKKKRPELEPHEQRSVGQCRQCRFECGYAGRF